MTSSSSSNGVHHRILNRHGPPPRILHSDAHSTLDPLLLDLISLICREHILNWYNNISRDPDRAFVNQVTAILIHVVQALEVRLANVDLVELVTLDLPAVLEAHVKDFDEAELKAKTGHAHNLDRDNVFHLLQPHLAISLVASPATGALQPVVDKAYLRALVTNLLVLLLPPEDYRAEMERSIVREIIVNVVFGSLVGRVAQPWFLHMMIARVLEARANKRPRRRTNDSFSSSSSSSGGNATNSTAPPSSSSPPASKSPLTTAEAVGSAQILIQHGLDYLGKFPPLFRAVTASISALYHTATSSPIPPQYSSAPPLAGPSLSFLESLLPRSPAVSQAFHYINLPLTLASSFVTSLVFYVFSKKVFTPNLTRMLLEISIKGLFPNGHPPPKEPDPSPEEREILRQQCEERIAEIIPILLARVTLPPSIPNRKLALSQYLLRPISSHVANVHLFIVIIDLVVGKLFPELLVRPED